jgi:mercuric reductase
MSDRNEWTLEISGMTCDACGKAIDEALARVPGVMKTTTRYGDRRARVVAEPWVDLTVLAGAIAKRGYKVAGHSSRPIGAERALGDEAVDLAIVGGGSAGFAAAIRAADLGATAAIIEAGSLGGTCVNVGCVPSKTLIRAAEVFHRAGHHAFAGIRARPEPPDMGAIVRQKAELVAELQQAKYWDVLAAYPSIQLRRGRARFRSDGTLEVDGRPLRARKVLLAMGASPWAAPIPGLEETAYLTSTEALSLPELPNSLLVIGASAVGLEIAQLLARLGTKVTVLEALPRIVPAEDAEVGEGLAAYLREEGMDVYPGVTVKRVSGAPGAYRVEVDGEGKVRTFTAEQLLVATGRRPNTKGMGLEEAGIRLGKKGEVHADEHLETTRQGVYAAGDVTGDPMFVYVAAHEGALAAENALQGNVRRIDLSVVPRVTFTDPAVASVGLTEAQARERGLPVAVAKLPLSHVPRALAARDTRGFIKLVADERTNLLVGAHILAPEAGEIIQQAAMAIRFGIRVDEIAGMLHPYLTLAEGLKLAAQTFEKDVARLSCCAA